MVKRLLKMRIQLNEPVGVPNPANILIDCTGGSMRVLDLVIGPDDYAAGRTITVQYGIPDVTPALLTVMGTLMSESIDNVVRVVIPRGAATGAPDTTYHRDIHPGFLLERGIVATTDMAILISAAALANTETLTVALRAILGDSADPPTISATATTTWTAFSAGEYYKEVVPIEG